MKPILNKEKNLISINTYKTKKKSSLASVKKNINFYSLKLSPLTRNGARRMDDKKKKKYIHHLYKNAPNLKFGQFIPASKDEENMFQDLLQFHKEYNPSLESFGHYINRTKKYDFLLFFKHLRKFPFYPFLKKTFLHLKPMGAEEKKIKIAQTLLYNKDFNYAKCPKAFIPFHANAYQQPHTAFEEHLLQFYEFSCLFNHAEFHCSFNKKFKDLVQKKIKNITSSNFFKDKDSSIFLSFCDKQVKAEHTLFQLPSFISSLNSMNVDIVYMTMMENLGSTKIQKKKSLLNKILCGKLLDIQQQLFKYLQKIEAGNFSKTDSKNLFHFLEKEFLWETDRLATFKKTTQLYSLLNRPLRVGVVIPLSHKEDSMDETENSTRYILVEMWCAVKTYKGEKFDLSNFTKESEQEVPFPLSPNYPCMVESDLWNKSMKNWNSIFVEIDPRLYTPVKIINDLLSKDHQ